MTLTEQELHTLLELGPLHLRRSRARGGQQRTASWGLLTRLVTPLEEARPLPAAQARAAGLVLQHCADLGRSYWGSPPLTGPHSPAPQPSSSSSPEPHRPKPRRVRS